MKNMLLFKYILKFKNRFQYDRRDKYIIRENEVCNND